MLSTGLFQPPHSSQGAQEALPPEVNPGPSTPLSTLSIRADDYSTANQPCSLTLAETEDEPGAEYLHNAVNCSGCSNSSYLGRTGKIPTLEGGRLSNLVASAGQSSPYLEGTRPSPALAHL